MFGGFGGVMTKMPVFAPKALLFDLDGVLIDSVDSWWYAVNEAFKHYQYQSISKDHFIREYWGHDLREILPKKYGYWRCQVLSFYLSYLS